MMSYVNAYANSGLTDIALHGVATVAPAATSALYPMEAATAWHYAHHIKGLTGTWMDLGAFTGGAVRGSFHRMAHGHHLITDGLRVLVNPKLKYGEFLHHLGMDFLTKRGIPNPLLPTAAHDLLLKAGLSKSFAYELMTLNLQKVLGGGVSIVCAGNSVLACFSDAIPHTFSAAGVHFLYGTLDMLFGFWPITNPLCFIAAGAEYTVAATTAVRALCDPVLPVVGMTAGAFFPLLGGTMLFSGLLGAGLNYWSGRDWKSATLAGGISATASAVSLTTGAALGGTFLAPFLGPAAGILTAFLLRKAFMNKGGKRAKPLSGYRTYDQLYPESRDASFGLGRFGAPKAFPFMRLPQEPIGELCGDRLLLRHTPSVL